MSFTSTYHQRTAKKQKVAPGQSPKHALAKSDRSKPKGGEKAFERVYIPIPGATPVRDDGLSVDDEALLDEFGDTINFLAALDHQGIARYFVPLNTVQSH